MPECRDAIVCGDQVDNRARAEAAHDAPDLSSNRAFWYVWLQGAAQLLDCMGDVASQRTIATDLIVCERDLQ